MKYGIPETVYIRGVTHTVEIKDSHGVIRGIDNADNIGISEKNTDVILRSIYEFMKTNKINIFGD